MAVVGMEMFTGYDESHISSDRISDPTGDWSEVVRVRDRESRLKPRWSTAGRRDLAKGDGGGATVPTLQCRGTVHGREKAARVSPGSLQEAGNNNMFLLTKLVPDHKYLSPPLKYENNPLIL